jgi:hypothetical protein
MPQNVGVADQVIRITLGFALLFAGFIIAAPLKYLLFALGLAAIVSGFAGRCLLYRLLGVRT